MSCECGSEDVVTIWGFWFGCLECGRYWLSSEWLELVDDNAKEIVYKFEGD